MDELLVEKVLRCVELVPAGRVVAYGEVGRIVGAGPRQVGAVIAHHGHLVSWWRVTNSDGDLPPHLRPRAAEHWADEGIVWKPNGLGCRIADHRVDLEALAAAWHTDTADLREA
ncbi:MGMT family protein [Kytococcus sp. HMSC28H12]|uniref:MGMT family protein n=1 Tax=Kytococcus sp. HMSC28H12 TaxID=1581067 RepID=UPI0008A1DE37|nr:MGMT family protein [Kytococcus sp. HMSC28H12]OFS14918.1 cysteine methyltransferase [Kytococcus sp. HMSC28H12]